MPAASGFAVKEKAPSPPRKASISLLTATGIVVANIIGTGVFTSLGFQVAGIPSPFALMVLWAVGGVVALCGALSYAELAAALPRSGGEYHFLSRIFHPALGFLAGWISATVGFAAPIALAAMAFGTYLHRSFHHVPGLSPLALSLLIVWLASIVHFTGIRRGGAFQNFWTVLKVALILAFVLLGLMPPHPQPISFAPAAGDLHLVGTSAFAISLVYVMYAYSGWNASTYIVNEIREPQRNVPRSLFLGTLLVILLYIALNAVFLHSTPMSAMAGKLDVALVAGREIFGPTGERVMAVLICVGLVSTISSMTWIGPRVSVAMGEDFRALRLLALKTKSGIPRVALALQLAIVTALLCTFTFEKVLVYIQLALTLCSFLTVLGVFVLRVKEPALPRPYRTWGYPLTPLIFLAVSAWMMFYIVSDKPRESLAGLATMLAGLLVYFVSAKGRAHENTTVETK